MSMNTGVPGGYEGDRSDAEDGVGVVLHEERLRAGVERIESGRVEIRKRIVVEELTVTVPVRREVVDVVRVYPDGSEEPVAVPADAWEPRVDDRTGHEPFGGGRRTDADDAGVNGPSRTDAARDGQGADLEVVLHEERPVITSEVYAVERIRLDVTGTQTSQAVTAEVRREVADLDVVSDYPHGEPELR